jgi:hypothetical protein
MPKRIKAKRVPGKHERYEFDDMHSNMLVARVSETGTDMIRAYGKIEAVVEMYIDGTLNAIKAFDRITEIINGKGEVPHA